MKLLKKMVVYLLRLRFVVWRIFLQMLKYCGEDGSAPDDENSIILLLKAF